MSLERQKLFIKCTAPPPSATTCCKVEQKRAESRLLSSHWNKSVPFLLKQQLLVRWGQMDGGFISVLQCPVTQGEGAGGAGGGFWVQASTAPLQRRRFWLRLPLLPHCGSEPIFKSVCAGLWTGRQRLTAAIGLQVHTQDADRTGLDVNLHFAFWKRAKRREGKCCRWVSTVEVDDGERERRWTLTEVVPVLSVSVWFSGFSS